MNVRVHYPQTEEGLKELYDRLASIQAEIIIGYINNLNCTYEEKVQLLKQVAEKD